MNKKLEQLVDLLHEIDDELNNEMCLDAEAVGIDEEECGLQFTFWGVADMIIDYMQRRNSDE
jgi:hypothetical protein